MIVSPRVARIVGPGVFPLIAMTSFELQSGDLYSYFTSHLNRRIRASAEGIVVKEIKTHKASSFIRNALVQVKFVGKHHVDSLMLNPIRKMQKNVQIP